MGVLCALLHGSSVVCIKAYDFGSVLCGFGEGVRVYFWWSISLACVASGPALHWLLQEHFAPG